MSPAPRPHSVFIGFRETAGYLRNLGVGFEAIGTRATVATLYPDPWAYASPGPTPVLVRLVRRTRAGRGRTTGVGGTAWRLLDRLATLVLFGWAVLRHDAFVFGSTTSFFQLRELGLLRRLGKSVVVVSFGTDSRPAFLNGAEVAGANPAEIARAASATRARKRMVEQIERHATAVVCHTMSAQLHRRPMVPFLRMGLPVQSAVDVPVPASTPARAPVRILHAPSSSRGKGTETIRDIVGRLQADGVAIEYVEVHGQPNAVVLAELARCDLVVDQLYADTPMSTLPAEAAAFGKATVVAGYGWDELRRVTSIEDLPPTITCRPEDVETTIRALVTDRDARRVAGEAARTFVTERWAPATVAGRFLALFEAGPPSEWLIDPSTVQYAHGAGISEDQLKTVIRELEKIDPTVLDLLGPPDVATRLREMAALGAAPP